MHNISVKYFKTPFGELILGDFEEKLCLADWRYRKMRGAIDKRIQTAFNAIYTEGNTSLLEETEKQLREYFSKERKVFDLPLKFAGTQFQKRVWDSLLDIPYGNTESYLGLSKIIGDEKAIRAVSTANGANAISIIVPCHRILGSDGSLVGYAGGLIAKKKLLQMEGVLSQLELF